MASHSNSSEFLWDSESVPLRTPKTPDSRSSVDGLPAEIGLWIFVFGDMTIFGYFFLVFLFENRSDRAQFAISAAELHQPIGVANTLVLLLSSYLVVLALQSHRAGLPTRTRRLISGARACALAFAGLKVVEYTLASQDGHTPATNRFFTFYFILTGVHLVHVLIGGAWLTVWARSAGRKPWTEQRAMAESAAVYWHMVDLLWMVIFTLLYLTCVA